MLVLYFVCICQRLPRHNQSVHNSTTFLFVFYPLPKSNVANIIEFYIAKEKKFYEVTFRIILQYITFENNVIKCILGIYERM